MSATTTPEEPPEKESPASGETSGTDEQINSITETKPNTQNAKSQPWGPPKELDEALKSYYQFVNAGAIPEKTAALFSKDLF
jgi:hypothetical protein